jgi:23S rRNA (adenine2030-N6)-methyltransferase
VAFKRQFTELNVQNVLCIEQMLRAPADPRALNGNGLVVINPPFTLKDNMSELLPFFADVMARGEHPSWSLTTLNDPAG